MEKKIKEKPAIADVQKRFEVASAKLQASVQRHVQIYESSSEEEDLEGDTVLSSVLQNYAGIAGKKYNLGKTQHHIEECFQSKASTCLICIASIKRADPIWTCNSCYTFLHIVCIQKWARDTIFQQKQAAGDQPIPHFIKANQKIEWCCPKCRFSYGPDYIPDQYTCFCGKEIDPPYNVWCLPHSCGETCNKQLPSCNHKCLLLCHPGPCPPCPKMVDAKCNCGKSPTKYVRCNAPIFSCGNKCEKVLSCNSHRCNEICHPENCPPCSKKSFQYCVCSKFKSERPCSETVWKCDKVCGRVLDCGFHKCDIVCHPKSECWQCPFSGTKKCSCGSTKYEVVCPEEVPCCGDTCMKDLPCGIHTCSNKCHKDECPPCPVVINKKCRCGLHEKVTPCSKDFTCSSKCGKLKECGRHTCVKKCCANSCTPCNKECQRPLQCGRHKCSSPCHSGPCYPCPLMSKVSCRCGLTFITVPCGRERRSRPPKCSKICKIPLVCNHKDQNRHICHFGACPPCKERCGILLPCGHECQELCHAAVRIVEKPIIKPATPWEVKAPKVEIKQQPCPPCKVMVPVQCVGGHDATLQPCSKVHFVSCGRPCGRKLKCGNHVCQLTCHPITNANSDISEGVIRFLILSTNCDNKC